MAILNTEQIMEKYNIGSRNTVFALFRTKGSPAFRVGRSWMVDDLEFKEFLYKQSEQFKG